jgi:hypothetical protein
MEYRSTVLRTRSSTRESSATRKGGTYCNDGALDALPIPILTGILPLPSAFSLCRGYKTTMIRRSAGIAFYKGLAVWTSSHVVVIPPPSTASFTIQRRWFAARVRYNLKGFGPDGVALKINFCRNDYDLYSAPRSIRQEQYQYVKSVFNLRQIKEKTREEFETDKDLEYYNGEEWLPLTNMDDIKPWKGGAYALDIRVPSQYDDVYEYTIQSKDKMGSIIEGRSMMKIIRSLVLECQRTGVERSKVKRFHLSRGTTTVPTRQWVMTAAESDALLRSVLLRRPGALDHIVKCLHLDFLWHKRVNPKLVPGGNLEVHRGYLTRSFSV